MASTKKQSQLDGILKFLKDAEHITFVKFGNTKHLALENLRKELRKNSSGVKVVKNSILQKALNQLASSKKTFKNLLPHSKDVKDNTAVVKLGSDWSKGLGSITAFSDKEQAFKFRFGLLDGNVYNSDELVKISKLPPRIELIAKVIGGMKNPMSSFTYAMKYNMQKFVYILNERSKQS